MNTIQVIALALAFVASVSAIPGAPVYGGDYYAYPKYSYSYGVKDALTGDAKSAHETRDGGVVKGSYSLVQPDGVLRTVNYVADPIHGFQAQVINSPAAAVHKAVVPAHYGHGIAAVAKPVAVSHAHHAAPVLAGYGGHGYGHIGHHAGIAGIGYGHAGGLVGGLGGHGYGHY